MPLAWLDRPVPDVPLAWVEAVSRDEATPVSSWLASCGCLGAAAAPLPAIAEETPRRTRVLDVDAPPVTGARYDIPSGPRRNLDLWSYDAKRAAPPLQ